MQRRKRESERGLEERLRTSLLCECLKTPLGHGDLTGNWHIVMCSISAPHSIHFLCLIHHYVTLTFRVCKSFYATETSLIFGNTAWQSGRKGKFRHDEQDRTVMQKSDSLHLIRVPQKETIRIKFGVLSSRGIEYKCPVMIVPLRDVKKCNHHWIKTWISPTLSWTNPLKEKNKT